MKKFILVLIFFLIIFIFTKKNVTLSCDNEGNFKILVVADPQCDTKKQWYEARDELEVLIERSNPDFVLINGDMNSNNNVPSDMWELFIYPITSRNIYWSTTNGNHDPYSAKNYAMYKRYKYCLNNTVNVTDPNYEYYRPMNYVIPIYSNDKEKIVFAIYGMDSGTVNEYGYEGLTKKQIKWYKSKSNKLKDLNGGDKVTSLLCIHIPLTQTLDMVYSSSGKNGEIYGITNQNGNSIKNYVLENGTVIKNANIHTTAPQNDQGMFKEILNQGDIKVAIFGHEHKTNIIGSYKGVLLGFAGKLSTGCYSDNLCRGGRVIEFNQSAPQNFKVYWIGSMQSSKDQEAIYYNGEQVK